MTDALLVLGLVSPERFLAGRERIDPELARRAIEERFATPLGRSVEEAAQWIYTLTVARMSNATRSVSIERGFDPRQFTFFSFGGTSPLFQSEICRSLRIARHRGAGRLLRASARAACWRPTARSRTSRACTGPASARSTS